MLKQTEKYQRTHLTDTVSPNYAQPMSPKSPFHPHLSSSKIRLRSLFGGEDGFFKDVYRVKKKRRESGKASQSSGGSTSGSATSEARTSASLSPTTTRIIRTDTLPPPLQQVRSDDASALTQLPTSTTSTEEMHNEVLRPEEVPVLAFEAVKLDTAGSSVAAPPSEPGNMVEEHPEHEHAHSPPPPPTPPQPEMDRPQEGIPSEDVLGLSISVQQSTPTLTAAKEAAKEGSEHGVLAKAKGTLPDVETATASASGQGEGSGPRSTPPAEDEPNSRTLSQIIRHVGSENARKEVIDLTFDDSDGEAPQPGRTVANKQSSQSHLEAQQSTLPCKSTRAPPRAVGY